MKLLVIILWLYGLLTTTLASPVAQGGGPCKEPAVHFDPQDNAYHFNVFMYPRDGGQKGESPGFVAYANGYNITRGQTYGICRSAFTALDKGIFRMRSLAHSKVNPLSPDPHPVECFIYAIPGCWVPSWGDYHDYGVIMTEGPATTQKPGYNWQPQSWNGRFKQ